MPSVRDTLSQPGRLWRANPPASEEEIERLLQACTHELPDEYLDLLRFSNGGEGDIALPPLWFALYNIDDAIMIMNDESYREDFPQYLFFGGNGGMEMIGFDLRKSRPWPIVMVDPIAGEESAIDIAKDINQFIEAIGLEYDEDEGEREPKTDT